MWTDGTNLPVGTPADPTTTTHRHRRRRRRRRQVLVMTESTTKRLPAALFDPGSGDADADAFLAGDADVPKLGAVINHSLPEVGQQEAKSDAVDFELSPSLPLTHTQRGSTLRRALVLC